MENMNQKDNSQLNNGEAMSGEKKKQLIRETITGRRVTPGSMARLAGLFAVCGAAFGLCAALTFCGVRALGNAAEARSEDKGASAEEADLEETAPDSDEGGAVTEAESQTDSADASGDTDANGNKGSTDDAGVSESEADIEDSEQKYAKAYESIMEFRRTAAKKASGHIVSITGTSTGTTWFDSMASSSQTFAGLILSVGTDEILVLTTAEAAKAESFKVCFSSGPAVDAYVKQLSEKDNLAVLAVSAKNGVDESILNEISGIEFAGIREIENGEPVIAVGAPLGTVGSYSFGSIGYISEGEAGFDIDQNIFYANVNADVGHGTFIVDYDGRLVGIAAANDESIASGSGLTRIVSATSLLGTINNLKQGKQIAYAGIKGTEVTFDMRYSGIPDGIYVTDVDHGSAAYAAGIMRGDIVSEINGQTVATMEELSRIIRQCGPEQQIKLKVMRSGSSGSYSGIDFSLKLEVR